MLGEDGMSYDLTINVTDDWVHVTVTGQNTMGNVQSYLNEAVAACQEADCTKLLIEERLEGPRLSTLDVFKVASKRAEASRGHFTYIAYIDHFAEGDLMKFAETVANNRGSQVKIFASVADAEAWLRAVG